MKKTKIVCTIGPGSDSKDILNKMQSKGMDFARINMSHAPIENAKELIHLIRASTNVPIIVDTQGAELRTGALKKEVVMLEENKEVIIHNRDIIGDEGNINFSRHEIINHLNSGDIILINDGKILLKVKKRIDEGLLTTVIKDGVLAHHRPVTVDSLTYKPKILTEKDEEIIKYALENGVEYVALSFVNRKSDIDYLRKLVNNQMKIISKIENQSALNNIDSIIEATDIILIDRFDLGASISLEKIPLTQKLLIKKCKNLKTEVFVASHLLESMCTELKPTRAEVNDVINTLLDGADGLVLAGETALGKNPVETVSILAKLCKNAEIVVADDTMNNSTLNKLEALNYLESAPESNLIDPHGGKLVNKELKNPNWDVINTFPKLVVNQDTLMDAEQIAIGTFSPLEGFMCKKDFEGVLDNMHLSNGVVWPIPIILDVDEIEANKFNLGENIALTDSNGTVYAVLNVQDKYSWDKDKSAQLWFGTIDLNHPGVKKMYGLKNILIGGDIRLVQRRSSPFKEYEITPKQSRKIFEEKGWSSVVGFHTRNAIHQSHEFIQMRALEDTNCDGLFVHPIIGSKKQGDFESSIIIKSYEIMQNEFYPKGKTFFATFATFSRYAGPREAVFTALCRKNFGCSHFIVGRDHTGVGNYYDPNASHQIFKQFPELGIKAVTFNHIDFCKQCNGHVLEDECTHEKIEKLSISGTEARRQLVSGETPPDWFMRSRISEMIIDKLKNDKEVFVK
jgi:pyruvate kinase